ncbi:DinB family protein [bacterium]|nr:DinB family protein [bacterium]
MTEAQSIATRIREVILDGKLIANTNLKALIEDIDVQMAHEKIENLNTIALLSRHLHYYLHGVMQVLKGGKLEIRDKFSFDFEAMKSEEEWTNFKQQFWKDTEEFTALIEQLSDDALDSSFVKEEYGDYKRNLEIIIEHSYYHLGQISLLKKMLTKSS